MEQQLMDQLVQYRRELKGDVAAPGFAADPRRNDKLAELLALDRLISACGGKQC
jgi:hypothetical protein